MPADVSASSSTVVETVRQTPARRRSSRSRSHEVSNTRSKHQHQRTLEPPLEQSEASSSPRLHATSSPAGPRASASTSSRRQSNGGGSAQSASRRPHVDLGTPQHANSPPHAWPQDEISLPRLRDHDSVAGAAGWMSDDVNNFFSSDDHFLSNLANDAQTSSPSHLPSSVNRSRPQPPAPSPQRQGRRTGDLSHSHAASPGRASGNDAGSSNNFNTNTSQSTTQNSTSAATSFNSARSFLTNDSSNVSFHDVSTTQTSLASDTEDMPATTRRQAAANNNADDLEVLHSSPVLRSAKRRRTPARATPNKTTKRVKLDDDDPFADIEETAQADKVDGDDLCMIDLTEPKEPAKEPSEAPEQPPRNPNVNRLSGFQCAICMDDVTSLTVTHCGHMYCAQCLHSSLHVETTKGKCPMCRAKLDMKPREEYNTRTRGFYHLELKLMTRSKKGKRKAGEAS